MARWADWDRPPRGDSGVSPGGGYYTDRPDGGTPSPSLPDYEDFEEQEAEKAAQLRATAAAVFADESGAVRKMPPKAPPTQPPRELPLPPTDPPTNVPLGVLGPGPPTERVSPPGILGTGAGTPTLDFGGQQTPRRTRDLLPVPKSTESTARVIQQWVTRPPPSDLEFRLTEADKQMALAIETDLRAARRVQRAWRRHRCRQQEAARLQALALAKAASAVQRCWRRHLLRWSLFLRFVARIRPRMRFVWY